MDRRSNPAGRLLLLIAGGFWLASLALASAASPPKHFIFAISWEPAFCEGKSGAPECRSESSGRADATNFSLHGLWADDDYCDVAQNLVSADKSGDWESLPAPRLSPVTRTALDAAMPGTQSALDRHEWLKHGSCARVAADIFFSRQITLLSAVNASPVRALFAANIGKTLTQDQIKAAFDRAFGAGAGDRIRVACERDGGRRIISEITIGLYGDVVGSASLARLIATAHPTANNGCDQGAVDAVGLQ